MNQSPSKIAVARSASELFSLEDAQVDSPNDNEVLVAISGVGVCHTDLLIRDTEGLFPRPCVLGHEGSGVVIETGANVQHVEVGDHVVLSFSHCGQCSCCEDNKPYLCEQFIALNIAGSQHRSAPVYITAENEAVTAKFFGQSSFSSYALADAQCVVKIQRDTPLEIMGPLGCGIQTGAGSIFNALKPEPGTSIVIFGAGAVGLSALLAAVIQQCRQIIMVDIKEDKLSVSSEFGATHTLNPNSCDIHSELLAITGGGAAYSLECTGNPSVLSEAISCLRPGGTCGVVGTAAPGASIPLDITHLSSGRTITGIVEGNCNPHDFIPKLIAYWREGIFPFDKLITQYQLADINTAIADMSVGKVIKPVLIP